jgi:Protein of unknown function (DUF3037)
VSEYQYALLRVVPRIERGERLNAGIVLFCRQQDFLGMEVHLDRGKLAALAPRLDADAVETQLEALARVARGDAAAGAVASLPPSERFGWITAPSSTVIQPSDVHTGLCDDAGRDLRRLFAALVL